MNIRNFSLVFLCLISSGIEAASEQIIWGKTDSNYHKQGIAPFKKQLYNTLYQLKPVDKDDNLNSNHIRYQMYYKDIPIWGHELIWHKTNFLKDTYTGVAAADIERDIISIESKLTAGEVEKTIISELKDMIIFKNTEKIIYLDSKHKAHLAYLVVMYTNSPTTFVSAPQFIVDANSGEILKQWDALNHQRIGQGIGGNVFVLPYRTGLFQHGTSVDRLQSLGKFEVTIRKDRCFVKSTDVRVINIDDTNMDSGSFPVLSIVESFKKIPTFSYPCSEQSKYVNKNDGGSAPANFSFSSINDTMYFATVTLEMYKNYYGLEKPIGNDLPLRAYTHIKHFDNAFAVPNIKIKGVNIIHQQIVIGDGDKKLTAPAQGTLAHELSHNVTQVNSSLIYEGHSGGINEAFSDMASIAMQDYLREKYPWYWDGKDWTIGHEATIGANPLRYMDEPEKDGHSISNANDYNETLDVHDTSGVFNKAFYLLANKPNWSVRKAFQIMVDANVKYWTSGTSFDAAACGVIQAAVDRHYSKRAVIDAFAEVGVVCPIPRI